MAVRTILLAASLEVAVALSASASNPPPGGPLPPGCTFSGNFIGGRLDCTLNSKQFRGPAPAVTVSVEASDAAATGLLKYQKQQCVLSGAQISVLQLALAAQGGTLRVGFFKAMPGAACLKVGFSQF